MSKISVVRHAATAYNKNEVFMGILDIPLETDSSIAWREISSEFENKNCKVCYTSPLLRAYDTAKQIFDKSQIIIDERLIERNLGEWAGLSKKEVRLKYPKAFSKDGVMDFYYTPEGGEHYECLIKRVAEFLIEMHEKNAEIAIVSHNGVFRVMKSLILGVKLGEVFKKYEPHLEVQTFELTNEVIRRIKENCYYVVD